MKILVLLFTYRFGAVSVWGGPFVITVSPKKRSIYFLHAKIDLYITTAYSVTYSTRVCELMVVLCDDIGGVWKLE